MEREEQPSGEAGSRPRAAPPWVPALLELAEGSGGALTVELGAPLSKACTLRIGGPADALVRVSAEEGVAPLLALVGERRVPLLMVGRGANLLFPDPGLEGVVCRFAGELARWEVSGTTVRAGAGVVLAQLARACARDGLVGLEALAGFPASVGGAVRMNAGCYGVEIADVLRHVDVLDAEGVRRRLDVSELDAGYRSTRLEKSGEVVLEATFELERGDPAEALRRLDELNRRRWDSLPSGSPNAGSIFRNPPGDAAGRLLEECGLKGLRVGGASFSAKHANVIVNEGDATARDVLELMARGRTEVERQRGVTLRPELILVGDLGREWRRRFPEA